MTTIMISIMPETEYVCDSWSQGGPITNESQESYRDIL